MIGYEILEQNYEKVRGAIAAILLLEFENQFTRFYNTDCDFDGIYIERSSPINTTEIKMINVSYSASNYERWSTGYVDGLATYYVDFWTKAKSTSTEDGDSKSAILMQRLMGIGRAILENPIYKTMGFTPGQIGNVRVTKLESGEMKKADEDMSNVKVGRLTLQMKLSEGVPLPAGNELEEALTQIYLNGTDLGYRYEFIA